MDPLEASVCADFWVGITQTPEPERTAARPFASTAILFRDQAESEASIHAFAIFVRRKMRGLMLVDTSMCWCLLSCIHPPWVMGTLSDMFPVHRLHPPRAAGCL